MDKLLKEAIADAKAVRETALANAKIALEEAFTPKLQSMLNARINEEEDDEEEVEEVAEVENSDDEEETDENINRTFESDDDENDEEDVDESKDEDESEEEETDESFDLDAIIAELEKEDGDEEEVEEAADDKGSESDDEEIDLDELLASLDEKEDEDEKEKDETYENKNRGNGRISELETQLSEYRDAVVFLKEKINEINLLNAKLLYTNKLFKSNDSLTETQKVKILESLDRTKSIREVKLVYSTLAESFTSTPKSSKKRLAESIGFASKKTGKTKTPILDSGNALAARFQTLANINVKKKK